jgi:hypothetical protein
MESAGSRPKDDVSLPKATMTKIIKEMLPPDVRVAKDAQDLLVECCVGIFLTGQPDSLQLLLPNCGMFLIQLKLHKLSFVCPFLDDFLLGCSILSCRNFCPVIVLQITVPWLH